MAEALITCTKCKKRTPMSQMRYSLNGEDLVCQACLTSMAGGVQKPATPSSTIMPRSTSLGSSNFGSTSSAAASRTSSANKPIKYQCMSCNYTFTRASKNEMACPYCNRKTLRKEFKLVSDVDDLMGHLNTY